MPRKHPEPFWRSQTKSWYVQLGKKQLRLHADRDEAFRLYHELMARSPERSVPAAPTMATTALEVLDLFLEWASRNREPLTYEAYRRRLQCLADAIPPTLTCGELRPYHVTRVMDAKGWNANTKHDFATAVQRAFNWAVKQGIIDRSPIPYIEKPARLVRETVVTPEEYARVLETVEEPRFRDLIEVAWETGARVQELRQFEARFVDLGTGRIVLPPSKAKGKKHHRVIYLTDPAKEIVARLCKEAPTGPLLRNSEGNAWTKDAINCAFCRLQIVLGRRAMRDLGIEPKSIRLLQTEGVAPERLAELRQKHRAAIRKSQKEADKLARDHGTKYHLGAFRKGYATEALKNGVDTVTVAHLLGHADATMVSRVYAKVQQDPRYMAEAARRAKGLKADANSEGARG